MDKLANESFWDYWRTRWNGAWSVFGPTRTFDGGIEFYRARADCSDTTQPYPTHAYRPDRP